MSSREPDADDADTQPPPVERVQQTPGAGWERRYDAPLSVNPRPAHKDRRPVVLMSLAAVVVVVLGVLAWLYWPSAADGDESAEDTTPASQTESADAAAARLMTLLPSGYAPDACEAVVAPEGALAQVSCRKNGDRGGPLAATYTLTADEEALSVMFDRVIDTLSVVNCPGNIQSPGPWRRNATPQQAAGTLVCGFENTTSTVAWTTEADLLLSKVQSGPQGPNMVQLYTWWSSHS